MSYLYDSLRDALGGKSFRSGIVINNWSPNEVRAVYIMRDFILIADYLKQPKIIRLDLNEVNSDLLNRNRRGSLNNLLDNRQLSCMEEIYVDVGYSQYRDVIDLDAYVQGMFNQSSRLRYYGYVRGFDVNVLQNAYSQALINGSMDFTIAKNMGSFDYKDTGNKDWYKKYNLRPKFYGIDGEKGRLHTYFSKCERTIGETINLQNSKITQIENSRNIIDMFRVDSRRVYDLKLLVEFIKFSKGFDDFSKRVTSSIQDSLFKSIPVRGLTIEMFQQAVKMAEIPLGSNEKYLLDVYKKVSSFDSKGVEEFKPEEVIKNDGIYQFEQRLDYALASVLSKNSSAECCLMYLLTSKRIAEGLPEGKLTDILDKKKILMCRITPKGNLEGLLKFAYGLCGFIKEDFESYLKKETVK